MLLNYEINSVIIVLDVSGFTNDYVEILCNNKMKRKKSPYKKLYFNCMDLRFILHFATQRCLKFDTHSIMVSIRNIKKYNPKYVLSDRVYNIDFIIKSINE